MYHAFLYISLPSLHDYDGEFEITQIHSLSDVFVAVAVVVVGPHKCITHGYGLYPPHDALKAPTLLEVVASVCKPLPTRTQQLPTLLAAQCRKFLRASVCT